MPYPILHTQLFINGSFVDGAQGGVFETHNPATGELLAEVAEATSAGRRPRSQGSADRPQRSLGPHPIDGPADRRAS